MYVSAREGRRFFCRVGGRLAPSHFCRSLGITCRTCHLTKVCGTSERGTFATKLLRSVVGSAPGRRRLGVVASSNVVLAPARGDDAGA